MTYECSDCGFIFDEEKSENALCPKCSSPNIWEHDDEDPEVDDYGTLR